MEKYKNLKTKILTDINTLFQECGLSEWKSRINNGYGCKSKNEDKQEPGKCYAWDCPLAYQANLKDLKEMDTHLYNEFKDTVNEANLDQNDIDSDWIVQYRKGLL